MEDKKNAGISAVIGVIFVVAITVVVAVGVFSYVESLRKEQEEKMSLSLEGWVSNVYTNLTIPFENDSINVWYITLNENLSNNTGHTYQMIFDGVLPPSEGVKIRFFYDFYLHDDTKYFRVYNVENI